MKRAKSSEEKSSFSVRMPVDLKESLKNVADQCNISLEALAEVALEDFVKDFHQQHLTIVSKPQLIRGEQLAIDS